MAALFGMMGQPRQVREEFVIAWRVCQICGCGGDVLVSGKAPYMDRARLRDVIRHKLYGGALPTTPPRDKIYARYGSGAECDACGDPIQARQVEYELNYPDEHRTFRLHLDCADLWDAVRATRGLNPPL